MRDKYEILELNICTFKLMQDGIIPNLNDYPDRRLCVVDNERKKAIDVNNELEYDYIETMSCLYFLNESSKKIKENKRAAIFPVIVLSYEPVLEKKALCIISKLKAGYTFLDGNDALTNEEYLESINKEKIEVEEKQIKKKIFKRKK